LLKELISTNWDTGVQMPAIPSASQVRSELSVFAKPETKRGLIIFIADMSLYIVSIAVVLFAPWIWAKLAAGIFAGVKISNLVTIGHDAAHNCLTSSRTLNKFIAIVSFTPALFNYRLWLYDHHNLHHQKTNQVKHNAHAPLSKKEFDALTQWEKSKQRFYRSSSLWAFGVYYIVERWLSVHLIPQPDMPDSVRKGGWPHTFYLLAYLTGFLALLIAAPQFSETSSLVAILFGFVVPFYVFQSLFSFTIYVQHTNPRVAWFKDKPDRNGNGRQDQVSVQLVFPKWFSHLDLAIYEHGAHHVQPAIPLYRLREAQEKLNSLLGRYAVTDKFSFSWLKQVQDRCKLYDFENHQWLDFEGRPTSRITLTSEMDLARPVWAVHAGKP